MRYLLETENGLLDVTEPVTSELESLRRQNKELRDALTAIADCKLEYTFDGPHLATQADQHIVHLRQIAIDALQDTQPQG